jgi:hypothetical protein
MGTKAELESELEAESEGEAESELEAESEGEAESELEAESEGEEVLHSNPWAHMTRKWRIVRWRNGCRF